MFILLGLFFIVFSVVLFYHNSYPTIRQSIESKRWQRTSAQITHSKVLISADGLYQLCFEAEYTVRGRLYIIKNRYLESEGCSRWKREKNKFVREHPAGSKIPIYYSPKTPSEATIEPGFKSYYLVLIIIFIITFLIGVLVTGLGIMQLMKRFDIALF